MKPCFLFCGDLFERSSSHSLFKSIILDFYRGSEVDQIDLTGLDRIISLTADPTANMITWRVYNIVLKKSGIKLPRVELEEIGPRMNFEIRRVRDAIPEVMKEALKVPKESKVKKRNENFT